MRSCTLFAANEAQMMRIGSLFANHFQPSTSYVVTLSGAVGAGKSVFARGFVRRVMRDAALIVPSPTFAIMVPYKRKHYVLNHMDLYRLKVVSNQCSHNHLCIFVLWRAVH